MLTRPPAPITDAQVISLHPEPPEPASAAVPASGVGPEQPPEDKPQEVETKQPPRKPKRPPPPKPPQAPALPPQPPAAPQPAPIIATRLIGLEQARGMLDNEVRRPDGKVIGHAVDLLADPNGKPREMVVNLSGFMGVGDRKVNFPWSQFRFLPGAKKAPITLQVPPGVPPAAAQAKDKPPQPSAAARQPEVAPQTPPALAVIDATVQRQNGAKIGRVVDVLVDGNAQPQAAVVDVGNLISTDRRSIAADWSALQFVQKGGAFALQLNLSDAQLHAAPPYAADKPARAVSPVVPAPAAAPVAEPAAAAGRATR